MPTREEIIARKTAMRDAGMQWANMNDSSWGPGQEALWKKHQMSTIKFTAPERPVQYGNAIALPGVGTLGQIAMLASSALAIPQVREGIANTAQTAWDWVSDKAGKTANILRAGALATEAQLRGMFNNGNAPSGTTNQGNGQGSTGTANAGNNTGTAQPVQNPTNAGQPAQNPAQNPSNPAQNNPPQGGATGTAAGQRKLTLRERLTGRTSETATGGPTGGQDDKDKKSRGLAPFKGYKNGTLWGNTLRGLRDWQIIGTVADLGLNGAGNIRSKLDTTRVHNATWDIAGATPLGIVSLLRTNPAPQQNPAPGDSLKNQNAQVSDGDYDYIVNREVSPGDTLKTRTFNIYADN